jgi:hypothetical protein
MLVSIHPSGSTLYSCSFATASPKLLPLTFLRTLLHVFAISCAQEKLISFLSCNSALFRKSTGGGTPQFKFPLFTRSSAQKTLLETSCFQRAAHSSKFRIPQLLCLPLLRKLPGVPPTSHFGTPARKEHNCSHGPLHFGTAALFWTQLCRGLRTHEA